jgi:hypothetical protein
MDGVDVFAGAGGVGEGVKVNVFVLVTMKVEVNVALALGDGVCEDVWVSEGVKVAGWNGVDDKVVVAVRLGVLVAVGVSVNVGETMLGGAVVAGVI